VRVGSLPRCRAPRALRALPASIAARRPPARPLTAVATTNHHQIAAGNSAPLFVLSSDDEPSDWSDLDAPDAAADPLASAAASPELAGLAAAQLAILAAALEGSAARAGAPAALRCAAYCRAPRSLASGELALALVAATDAAEAEAAAARQDLFLGVAGGERWEAWIVEQPVIVLPDSGGIVLPLAHADFLVGLLLVERAPAAWPRAGGAAAAAARAAPPATSLFGGADLKLIRQTGAALALGMALDLRSALERAETGVRRRQVAGLVERARAPLTTLRTLSTMLAPRLDAGEPERDMADALAAQGERLGELVGQLQAALAPAAPGPLPLAPVAGALPGWAAPALPAARAGAGAPAALPAVPGFPAPMLPSSSIGGDSQAAALPAPPSAREPAAPPASERLPPPAPLAQLGDGAATELVGALAPLLASAARFAGVAGIAFRLAPGGPPTARVAVGPLPLKRLLAGLLDGSVAVCARGDALSARVRAEAGRAGAPGAAVELRLEAAAAGAEALAQVAAPEFGAVAAAARAAGARLDVVVGRRGGAAGVAAGAGLTAKLWLPLAAGE
jgi:hypothetical protein